MPTNDKNPHLKVSDSKSGMDFDINKLVSFGHAQLPYSIFFFYIYVQHTLVFTSLWLGLVDLRRLVKSKVDSANQLSVHCWKSLRFLQISKVANKK